MAQNRFMTLLGGNEQEEAQVPYKHKEEQKSNKPEYPKFDLDASKPYAGIVEQVWGKPKMDAEGVRRNNRIIKTQGVANMLRLVGEAVTGAMGGDIVRRGENKTVAKAAQNNEKLRDIFRSDQARYNAMRMQEMLKNMDYGIRQKQRAEDRNWQEKRFNIQQKAINDRMQAGFAHSDAVRKEGMDYRSSENEKNRAHQEKMANKRYRNELGLINHRNSFRGYNGDSQGVSLTDSAGIKHVVPQEAYDKLSKEVLSTLSPYDLSILQTSPRDGQAMLQARILDIYQKGGSGNSGNIIIPKVKSEQGGVKPPSFNNENEESVSNSASITTNGENKGEVTPVQEKEEDYAELSGLSGRYDKAHSLEEALSFFEEKLRIGVTDNKYKGEFLRNYMYPDAPSLFLEKFKRWKNEDGKRGEVIRKSIQRGFN